MPNYPEETADVSFPCPGRWVWNEETQTVDFVSCVPAEEGASRRRTQANVNFTGLQQRAEWLTELRTLDHRGRQSLRKSVSSAHLKAYRSSVMKKRGDLVTIDDVKQVAVRLLQENYSLPIPSCFLAVLRRKELDDVLAALLLYLSCFFEHKFLENKPKPLMEIDTVTEHQMVETLAKKEIAKKKLAVCYFSLLFMDLEIKQGQHKPYYKSQILPSSTEWLLDGCLYSFFCYVAWVTFGRKDLRDIQEEVGHLMYSDTFNMAVTSDGDSRTTSTAVNSSLKPEEDDPKETGYNGKFTHRTSQRHPALSSIANQRSPLMVSLFPSPKERSPHLFLGSRARRQSPLQAEHCDTKALTEQLNQQLASVSFGILGQSLKQFSYTTLIPHGEPKNNREKVSSDVNNN
ncbi:Protein phosphatase 1 regulatory subunit 36 [Channa argus]|uniref:Protein phosphatase 1 regulatory subunit 36 n=1 Tax=Channa argus TaxID=215402 RepID=A0A6G1QXM6_CHAAH|nr:Protein phosphatase 1 regulatory subunit 36 [Channa argus]